MKYKIEKQIVIDNPQYGALGDDFSFTELESLDIIIRKIESVLLGKSQKESIYGNMCYKIVISKDLSSIYCYDEFLGEESSGEIYNMFKEYQDRVKSFYNET